MSASIIKSSAVFRGDDEQLVEHLLFACHGHKLNKPLDSFGRALEPFFQPGEELGPLPNYTNSRKSVSCGSPPRSSKGNRARRASPPDVRRRETATTKVASSTYDLPVRGKYAGFAPASVPSCPGHFSSPSPAVLPMPTTGLLTKANSVPRGGATCTAPAISLGSGGFAVPPAAA